MQLFSIGLYMLNMDGTRLLDPDTNEPIPTYDNKNIQTFARAWTGFYRTEVRGNIEEDINNRIDPMSINGYWRDAHPKIDLKKGYIGDVYPLCSDLPEQQFLREGASYRLLGSSAVPDLHSQPSSWMYAICERGIEPKSINEYVKYCFSQLCFCSQKNF